MVAVHTSAPSTRMLTVLFGSAMPLKLGVVSRPVEPFAGVLNVGALGDVPFETTNPCAPDWADTLPAASVAEAVTWCGPLINVVPTTHDHSPEEVAVTKHTTTPSTRTVTVLFASAVPLNDGEGEVVAPTVGATTTGTFGATVSMVNPTPLEVGLVPFALLAEAVISCAPSPIAVAAVQAHCPCAFTTAVHTTMPSTLTDTVLAGAPRPEKVGVLSLVVEPFEGCVTTGVLGPAFEATVKFASADSPDTLPARSVEVALATCAPVLNAEAATQLYVPCAVATAVHATMPSTLTDTVLPASASPENVGVESVVAFAAGTTMVGAFGAWVSMVNETGDDVPLPVELAVAVCMPSVNAFVATQVK